MELDRANFALGLLCAEALRQHGVKQLFCCRFADRAGHANDLAAAHRAVAARKIEQRLRGVLNVQRRNGILLALTVAHDCRRARKIGREPRDGRE